MPLVILLINSCDIERDATIDPELQPYFDRFVFEADLRGIHVDFDADPISGDIISFDEDNVAGSCTRRASDVDDLRVNTFIWNQANDMEREYIIFHELGHCYLDREHLEARHPNGTCLSIMASGTGSCRQDYNDETRSTYIDELFSR